MQYLLFNGQNNIQAQRWALYLADCLWVDKIINKDLWLDVHGIDALRNWKEPMQIEYWGTHKYYPLERYWFPGHQTLETTGLQSAWWVA